MQGRRGRGILGRGFGGELSLDEDACGEGSKDEEEDVLFLKPEDGRGAGG